MRLLVPAVVAMMSASVLAAQEPDTVYQQDPQKHIEFNFEALVRQEWTTTDTPVAFQDDSRRLIRVKPRVEGNFGWLGLGVGGDFIYSNDDNDEAEDGTTPPLIRDNYRSKDARLDLAFARLQPVSWLKLEAGRFPMPVPVTEMIWDRDLRVQGAAVTLQTRDKGPLSRIALTGLGLRGGHVFENEETRLEKDDTEMVMGALTLGFGQPGQTQVELTGAYMTWRNLDDLVPQVRRQNTRVGGLVADDYDVLDGVARLKKDGKVPWQIVLEAATNRALDAANKGLWAAFVLGSTSSSAARAEYTYAKVDKDVTVAAYAADDFLWATGWDGHRFDLGVRTGDRTETHGIVQYQRFKDGPPAVSDVWERRFRLEIRVR